MKFVSNLLNLYMSILVRTRNEQEEKILIAFLESLKYNYRSDVSGEEQINTAFLDEYNNDVNLADSEIDAGNFVVHNDVEQLLKSRRKAL